MFIGFLKYFARKNFEYYKSDGDGIFEIQYDHNETNAQLCTLPSINEFPNDFLPFKEFRYPSILIFKIDNQIL
jgi:hypothetical protein